MTTEMTRPTTDTVRYTVIDSTLGPILLTSDGAHLTGLYLDDFDTVLERLEAKVGVAPVLGDDLTLFATADKQLGEYFSGTRTDFDLPLAPTGTEFQRTVWQALTTIPYGTTAGYGELAAWIDRPTAARAVGAANGRNPISIIVPCHRVIGANGALTGYAWGEEKKRTLLDLEASHCVRFSGIWRCFFNFSWQY
ncbi:methylated-DNA--[protein]-cysteine S-methyltransferase [Brevibacterium aurantiacum]|nr:methylated-DNA--[protein]-cysteine S-methyltransferase [Brevibacterium aurantiacum]